MDLAFPIIQELFRELGMGEVQQFLLEIGRLPSLPPEVREQVVAEYHRSACVDHLTPEYPLEGQIIEQWLTAADQLSQWGRWGEAARAVHRLAELERWSTAGRHRLCQWVVQILGVWEELAERHSGQNWQREQYQAILSMAHPDPARASRSLVGPDESIQLAQRLEPDVERRMSLPRQTRPTPLGPVEQSLEYLRSQDWAQAVEWMFALDPNTNLRFRCIEAWAEYFHLPGHPVESLLAHFQRLPQETDTGLMLGYLLFELRQYRQAEECFRVVLRKNLDHRVANLGLARTLQETGQLRGAFISFNKVLSLEPENIVALERLAQLLERQHEGRQAAHYYFMAAPIRLRENNASRAVVLCQRALQNDPEHGGAQELLVALGVDPSNF